MPIPMSCTCGRSFYIKDELAGKRIRCPSCQAILAVPAAEEEPLEVAARTSEQQPDGDELPARTPAAATRPAPARQPEPARKKKKRPWDEVEPRRSRRSEDEGWFGRTNAGVIGGLLMIIIAIVWFTVGFFALNIIFFYPPILLVIGLVAIAKGLTSSS
ncbi:MAG TPA: hypothetical protein VFA18_22685 [Gemmataceae bacterium]|nr:hypothetical protein [Gemmataceae bacterium]